ncbi:MAG: hypothetical protein ABSA47_05350, partial [Verrucomicrobiota bacterium]
RVRSVNPLAAGHVSSKTPHRKNPSLSQFSHHEYPKGIKVKPAFPAVLFQANLPVWNFNHFAGLAVNVGTLAYPGIPYVNVRFGKVTADLLSLLLSPFCPLGDVVTCICLLTFVRHKCLSLLVEVPVFIEHL